MEPNGTTEHDTLLEKLPTAVCRCRSGSITYANEAMGSLFDADPATLEDTDFAALVAEGDREAVEDVLAGTSSLSGNDGDGPQTVRFETDGGRKSTHVESEWVDDGEALVGTLRDVTERVRCEERLERQSEMLDSLLENVPMSIYFKDTESRHERVSTHMLCADPDSFVTNAEGKMHAHPDDVLGKTDYDIYGPDVAVPGVEADREIMESEEPVFNEITESTTNLGETLYTSTTKAPRYDDDGNVVGIVGVTMDVTDRLSYERELERQNERLEEFTEVLTHDLRNPLQVATGHVNLLAETCDDPSVEGIEDALERISDLIEEIRAFVIEGRTVESPEPVELEAVVREAWDAVDTADATLSVPATTTIQADSSRMRRMLENLVCNAVAHGGSDVTVTVGDLEAGFFVADDGDGIPDAEKEAVFDRGYTTGAEDTGFGLAIVKNIAEAHDWEVGVVDSTDGGARFEFTGVVRVEDDADEHF